jgi:class 3 adenylate cyclase
MHRRFMGIDRKVFGPAVTGHGGRICKNTGEGFLAESSSAIAAMGSALALQGAVRERNAGEPTDRQLMFRVGINVGDVIVGPDGIFGHNVDVAARLEALAESGDVLISELSTRPLTLLLADACPCNSRTWASRWSRPCRSRSTSIVLHEADHATAKPLGSAVGLSLASQAGTDELCGS